MSNISKRTYDTIDNELDAQITNLKEYIDTEIASVSGAEVTKKYVDDKATETLGAAKQYADGLSSGGVSISEVRSEIAKITPTISTLGFASAASYMGKKENGIDDKNTDIQGSGFGVAGSEATITDVKGGYYYFMQVKVYKRNTAYPVINTFPIYVPAIDDSNGRFNTSFVIDPIIPTGTTTPTYVHISGNIGNGTSYVDLKFQIYFKSGTDTGNISSVQYTLL